MNKVGKAISHIIFFVSILIGIPCAIFGLGYLIENFKSIGVIVISALFLCVAFFDIFMSVRYTYRNIRMPQNAELKGELLHTRILVTVISTLFAIGMAIVPNVVLKNLSFSFTVASILASALIVGYVFVFAFLHCVIYCASDKRIIADNNRKNNLEKNLELLDKIDFSAYFDKTEYADSILEYAENDEANREILDNLPEGFHSLTDYMSDEAFAKYLATKYNRCCEKVSHYWLPEAQKSEDEIYTEAFDTFKRIIRSDVTNTSNISNYITKLYDIVGYKVLGIYKHGSQIYGTAHSDSDIDLIIILDKKPEKSSEKVVAGPYDIVEYDLSEWRLKRENLDVDVVECLMEPSSAILSFPEDVGFFAEKLDLTKIRSSFSKASSNSWVKCKKKLTVESDFAPYIAKKSLWHSLRILMFGIQIMNTGKIYDYSEANELYKEIVENKSNDWEYYKEKYQPLYNSLKSEFKIAHDKAIKNAENAL